MAVITQWGAATSPTDARLDRMIELLEALLTKLDPPQPQPEPEKTTKRTRG